VVYLVDIVLVKADPVLNQTAIKTGQIISSLSQKYSVIALGWNRGIKEDRLNEIKDNEACLELFNVGAPDGYERHGTLRLLMYYPIFWTWVFIKLCRYKPKCVHACDSDTFLPCYLYKKLFRRKLVIDVFDRYALAYIPTNASYLKQKLASFINWLEEKFAENSDVLIAVSDRMFLTFRKKPEVCVTIMNCSKDEMVNRTRGETNIFKILYTGHIRPKRGLEILPNIVKGLNDTELIIVGRMENKKLLNNITNIPNIKYLGYLSHNKVIDLEASSDVMIALYDSNLQIQHRFGMADKILEAMMCGLPIITNIARQIIEDTGSGILVEYNNAQQITEAIVSLRDNPELRKKLGMNGRKAFLEKYNWTIMETKLYKIYEDLLSH